LTRALAKQKPVPSETELFSDFRTYCEELLWIRTKKGKVAPFKWNPVQVKLNDDLDHLRALGHRLVLLLKYRRPGITTLMQAKSFFLSANHEHQYAVTLAHDNLSTEKIFDMSLLFYERLPAWARPWRPNENKRELNFKRLGSVFYIGTAGGQSFGRGMTLQRAHGSEVAFWPRSVDVPNLVAGIIEATSEGEVVFETTANGHGNWFHKSWRGAKNGDNAWYPKFLSWKDDPSLYVETLLTHDDLKLTTAEEEIVKIYKLLPGQVLWRRQKQKELHDPDRGELIFAQEYPINDVEAFISSGSCFFNTEFTNRLVNLVAQPIQTSEDGRYRVFKHKVTDHGYIVSADISAGVPGGDRTIIYVLDYNTCEQVAQFAGYVSPEDCARRMADMGERYGNAMLAPEANEYGHSTLNTLINEIGYTNIYRHVDYDNLDGKPRHGWHTNSKTRPIMLSELRRDVQGGFLKMNDPEFFAECATFIDNGHGKYEASAGENDDRVMSAAIMNQARKRYVELSSDMASYAVDTGFSSISNEMEGWTR